MADGILTPCNVARSRHWFRQVTAHCNVAGKCCDEAETAHTQCGHQGVVRGQLQKTEVIASLTEDQSDASTWRLPGNYSRGLCLHIPGCKLSSDGRNRGLPARPQWRRAMRLQCIATRVGDWRNPCGWEQVLCGVRTWAIYHHSITKGLLYCDTTLAPWYPLDGRLGLTRTNQSASHVSKKREFWLPFLPRFMS